MLLTAATLLWDPLYYYLDILPMHLGLRMPDIDKFEALNYVYDEIPCTGNAIVTGTYDSHNMTVTISSYITRQMMMQALMHELTHFIQHYNNPHNYDRHYDLMHERFGYWDNPYEIEAREASAFYDHYFNTKKAFRRAVIRLFDSIELSGNY